VKLTKFSASHLGDDFHSHLDTGFHQPPALWGTRITSYSSRHRLLKINFSEKSESIMILQLYYILIGLQAPFLEKTLEIVCNIEQNNNIKII
jgi:hypothetical protein